MNKDRGFNYYDAYLKQVDYANELACNLESAIVTGDFGSRELVDALHTIENDADEVCHEVHAHLLTDFVVPFERGSMAALANAIDDISDTIEDVTIQAYYYHCSGIEPAGRETVSLVVLAIQSLRSAILLLGSLPTHDGKLKGHLLSVQDRESECDRIYIDAVHELYGRTDVDVEQRRIAHAILSAVEKISDAVETAAEELEAIIVEYR
ncbi:DUF47 domain-containing protein [Curtanaerobium respiraculi]|uniref:DUF47 domain-containing protein n=1 Tax=Curtanaerobium respiraculi TaxID=2949669 RepID=UPI0024B3C931|nr:DUF47 family protein [Curtanaerobium respiraculi]